MKYETAAVLLAFFGLSTSSPVRLNTREVPQEHSHNTFLDSVRTSLAANNPDNIGDPVFGLLGNAAAAKGQGNIADPDCLQQATADQAFTNAKAAGDVAGMTGALVYRAIERNTAKVGLASVACTSIKAVNPEIAALSQHQDPASAGAAATNKAITLELAKQIASIGGDPQTALQSGTFAPGDPNDSTGKGLSCDTADDEPGCIFSQNLLVQDATPDEITQAAAGASAAGAAANSTAAASNATVAASAAVNATKRAFRRRASYLFPPPAKRAAALDFGSCTDPSIAFGPGFGGRTEDSFEPSNLQDFNHGSALAIGVVAQFICGQLQSSCGASDAANAACTQGETAAASATGQAAADAFNSALGVSAAASSSSSSSASSTGSSAASAATPSASAASASSSSTNTKSAAAASGSSSSSAAASGGNVQTFTGTLGGAAPAVTNEGGDRPFVVNGDSFVNAGAAIQRSCSVQHNACATAVNSGSLSGGEQQCEDQETACNAANTA